MVNNTETYWEADGQSLHTYARSIETIGGMGPPPFRGEDITIPLQPGQMFIPKTPDSNQITLAMWLRGVAQSADQGVVQADKATYQSNYHDLVRMLYNPYQPINLRKRFYDGGILRIATAKAQYAGGLEPAMIGRAASRCTVNMKLHEGLFYDDTQVTVPLVDGNNNVTVLGNTHTTDVEVSIIGARDNVTLVNSTLGVGMTYPRPLLSGKSALIKSKSFVATETEGSTTIDVSPSVIHSGATQWMVLKPGLNVINLSSDFGTGLVSLKIRGAWT